MTSSKPAETTTAELAKTVSDEGWSVAAGELPLDPRTADPKAA
jgi:hypothetical protein